MKSQVQNPENFVTAIDIHTHPLMREGGCDRVHVDDFVAVAKREGIVHIVALGDVLVYGRSPTEAQIRHINDDTAWVMARHQGYVTGFCYLNPTLGERAVWREIERCVEKGFRGLKLEIANNARDACMRPLMEAAERYGLPVLQHSWSMTKIRQRRYHSDPADTALLAKRFRNVKVIMAHLTGCGVRGVLEAMHVDNLWVDTSGAAPEAGFVAYAIEKLGADRVLYGSDAPVRDFSVALARITDAGLDRRTCDKVLKLNAKTLLGLP